MRNVLWDASGNDRPREGTCFCLLPPPSGSFPTLGLPRPRVGRSRYGPKRQVQGDPVTLEKSSPNQTTWAGIQPRPHHFLPTFFNTNFHAVKATVNPPIPQTLVKWPGLSGTWYFSNFFFVIFHDFLCCFTSPTSLSSSFTLQEKTICVLLIP